MTDRPNMPKPHRVTPEPVPTPEPTPTPTPTPVPTPTPTPQPTPDYRTEPITERTPFRQIGDCSFDTFLGVLRDHGSPIGATEARQCYDAARGYTLMLLAQMERESTFGKSSNAQRTHNPLGLLGLDGRSLLSFDAWADACAAYKRRFTDPNYKSGVYMPEDMSLRQQVITYVGGPLCYSSNLKTCANGETADSVLGYLRSVVETINAWIGGGTTPTPTPTPPGHVTLGRVPLPSKYSERFLPQTLNTAWNDLGQRHMRGIVLHRMLGTLLGTDNYFRGEARMRARTDFGVGNGGNVFGWTPLNSRIAPWASGPADGVKGDAVAFLAAYGQSSGIGVNVFNRDMASIEIEGVRYTDPVPESDFQALIELCAYIADAWIGATYDRWPLNPDGVHCVLWHCEITSDKECPGDVVKARTTELIVAVGKRLQQYQSG